MRYFNEFESRIDKTESLVSKENAGGWRGPGQERVRERRLGLWGFMMILEMMAGQLEAWVGREPQLTEIEVDGDWTAASWDREAENFKENSDILPEAETVRKWLGEVDRLEFNKLANAVEAKIEGGFLVMWIEANRAGIAKFDHPGAAKARAMASIGWEKGAVSSLTMEAVNDNGVGVRNWWFGEKWSGKGKTRSSK